MHLYNDQQKGPTLYYSFHLPLGTVPSLFDSILTLG